MNKAGWIGWVLLGQCLLLAGCGSSNRADKPDNPVPPPQSAPEKPGTTATEKVP